MLVDGQCECGLEGDMRRGERKIDRRAGGWTM